MNLIKPIRISPQDFAHWCWQVKRFPIRLSGYKVVCLKLPLPCSLPPRPSWKKPMILTNITRMLFYQNTHFHAPWNRLPPFFPTKNKCRISKHVFSNFQFFFNQILVVFLFLLRGSQDYPQVWWLARRTHRTLHIVTLTAMIYCSKRIQSKISKGKRQLRWSRGNQVQTSFSQWSHTGQTYSSRDKLWCVRNVH